MPLKTLREHYSAAQLPIIMVTAKTQSDDIVAALELGANDYLTKPIDFPVALARIGTQLSHKHAQEALKESEERYAWRLVVRTMDCGTGIFSPTWCISRLAGRLCWAMKKEKSGTNQEEWFDRIHDADRERVKEEIAAHQKGSTPHFESEHRVLHKEGGFRWMLSRGSPSMTLPEMFRVWPDLRRT